MIKEKDIKKYYEKVHYDNVYDFYIDLLENEYEQVYFSNIPEINYNDISINDNDNILTFKDESETYSVDLIDNIDVTSYLMSDEYIIVYYYIINSNGMELALQCNSGPN